MFCLAVPLPSLVAPPLPFCVSLILCANEARQLASATLSGATCTKRVKGVPWAVPLAPVPSAHHTAIIVARQAQPMALMVPVLLVLPSHLHGFVCPAPLCGRNGPSTTCTTIGASHVRATYRLQYAQHVTRHAISTTQCAASPCTHPASPVLPAVPHTSPFVHGGSYISRPCSSVPPTLPAFLRLPRPCRSPHTVSLPSEAALLCLRISTTMSVELGEAIGLTLPSLPYPTPRALAMSPSLTLRLPLPGPLWQCALSKAVSWTSSTTLTSLPRSPGVFNMGCG